MLGRGNRVAVIVPDGREMTSSTPLASVVHYTDPSRIVIVIDDTTGLSNNGDRMQALSPDIVVREADRLIPLTRHALLRYALSMAQFSFLEACVA